MKKYFWTFAVMAMFAIGFAASDDDSSSSSSRRTESAAEKKQAKIDKMMKEAFKYGKEQAVTYTFYQECDIHYQAFYGTPESDEDIALFKKYKAEYDRGWDEGRKIKNRMND